LLARRGDLDELASGQTPTPRKLPNCGLAAGRVTWTDGIRALADVGNGNADLLADMVIKQGQDEEAERLHRFGLNQDGSIAWA
jgi:hypothetical protein